MKTIFSETNDKYVMSFDGRLDTGASSQTEREMKVLYDCEGHDIVLDCKKLEYISSSGLRLFLGVLKNATTKGSKVSIIGLSDSLRQIFDEIGFTRLFDIK